MRTTPTPRSPGPVGRPRRRGWFVTFEGPDGAGKTTQAERLATLARSRGVETVLTREPGGTPLGEEVRTLLLARSSGTPISPRSEALLFNAARAQLVDEVIRPALARAALVVAVRFADSTVAYQGFGAGLPLGELRTLEYFATQGLRPDLTILLDIAPADALARKPPGEWTRFEADRDGAFRQRVREGYLELAAVEPRRFVRVDAAGPAERVFEGVLGAVGRLTDLAQLLGIPVVEPGS